MVDSFNQGWKGNITNSRSFSDSDKIALTQNGKFGFGLSFNAIKGVAEESLGRTMTSDEINALQKAHTNATSKAVSKANTDVVSDKFSSGETSGLVHAAGRADSAARAFQDVSSYQQSRGVSLSQSSNQNAMELERAMEANPALKQIVGAAMSEFRSQYGGRAEQMRNSTQCNRCLAEMSAMLEYVYGNNGDRADATAMVVESGLYRDGQFNADPNKFQNIATVDTNVKKVDGQPFQQQVQDAVENPEMGIHQDPLLNLQGDAIPSKNRPTSKEAIVNKAGKVSQAALAVAQTSPSKPIVRSATKAGEAYKSGSENVAQMYVDNGLGGFENH